MNQLPGGEEMMSGNSCVSLWSIEMSSGKLLRSNGFPSGLL